MRGPRFAVLLLLAVLLSPAALAQGNNTTNETGNTTDEDPEAPPGNGTLEPRDRSLPIAALVVGVAAFGIAIVLAREA